MGVEKFNFDPKTIPTKAARADIARRYNRWGDKGYVTMLLRQLQAVIACRYGGPCDTDDGAAYLILSANAIANKPGTTATDITHWREQWTPHVPQDDAENIIQRALAKPRRFRADSAGRLIRLMDEERTKLKITLIGAIDLPKDKRTIRRREKNRQRKEEQRRNDGVRPRAQYLAEAAAKRAQWGGKSRASYYRALKRQKEFADWGE